MKASIIITSYKEPLTISKSIRNVALPNIDMWNSLEFLVVAPDTETIRTAEQTFEKIMADTNKDNTNSNGNNPNVSDVSDSGSSRDATDSSSSVNVSTSDNVLHYKIIRDSAQGKPNAINMSVKEAKGEILILTDGDMYISENSIKLLLKHFDDENVGGVSGHPVSQDNKTSQFGYYGHLFCAAAHKKRLNSPTTPMSGYLYAIRNDSRLWPLPKEIRAEDAYISTKLLELGYKLEYEPNALAYVKFPQNMKDWLTQKTRSLGGNVQLKHFNESESTTTKPKTRNIKEDLKMAYFPLTYAKTPKEFIYSLLLYPLRLYLWVKIYIQDKKKSYSNGAWQRIESTK